MSKSHSVPGSAHCPEPPKKPLGARLLELVRAGVLTIREVGFVQMVIRLLMAPPHLVGKVDRKIASELIDIAEKPLKWEHQSTLHEAAREVAKKAND